MLKAPHMCEVVITAGHRAFNLHNPLRQTLSVFLFHRWGRWDSWKIEFICSLLIHKPHCQNSNTSMWAHFIHILLQGESRESSISSHSPAGCLCLVLCLCVHFCPSPCTSFLFILPPWASPLSTLSTQLPPYPSRVASLLFSASFPSSKGISSSSTDSMRSLHSSHSGETEMLPQGKLALLLGPAFRGGGGPPRTDVTPRGQMSPGCRLHRGKPTSDSSAFPAISIWFHPS